MLYLNKCTPPMFIEINTSNFQELFLDLFKRNSVRSNFFKIKKN